MNCRPTFTKRIIKKPVGYEDKMKLVVTNEISKIMSKRYSIYALPSLTLNSAYETVFGEVITLRDVIKSNVKTNLKILINNQQLNDLWALVKLVINYIYSQNDIELILDSYIIEEPSDEELANNNEYQTAISKVGKYKTLLKSKGYKVELMPKDIDFNTSESYDIY